jgi:hypothetical protein
MSANNAYCSSTVTRLYLQQIVEWFEVGETVRGAMRDGTWAYNRNNEPLLGWPTPVTLDQQQGFSNRCA